MNRPSIEPKNSESIRKMFSSISGRYDLANSVLSLGIHHAWRKTLVKWSGAKAGDRVLDCASGTGDLAFEFETAVGANGTVTGTDFCEEMLQRGIEKGRARGSRVKFEIADVMNLGYADGSFDLTSIAFGIRNVADPIRGLSELARVTRPGGYLMVLEFGQSTLPVWGPVFDFYSKSVLPKVGGIITGKKDAYEYLQHSSSKFPCREDFVALAAQTKLFDEYKYKSLMGGIAYIYKLRRSAGAQGKQP